MSTAIMVTAAAGTTTITDRAHGRRPTRIEVELVGGRARIRTLDQGDSLAARPLQISGSRVRNRTHVSLEGRELLVEDLDVSADTRGAPGIIGPSKAISTVIAAGWRPDGERSDSHRLDFAGCGALYRSLDAAAHCAEGLVGPVFEQ